MRRLNRAASIDIDVTTGAIFALLANQHVSCRVPLGQFPVLSRLIALLRRLPAVQWAFGRLRPSPQVDAASIAPVALEPPPAAVVDSTEASPAACTEAGIGSEPSHDIITEVAPIAVESETIADLAEEPSEGRPDVGTVSSCTTLADVEPVIANDAPVLVVDSSDHSDAPVISIAGDPGPSGAEEVEPVAADGPAILEVTESSPGTPADIVGDGSLGSRAADVEPVTLDASAVTPTVLPKDLQADRPDVSIDYDTAEIEAVTVESTPAAIVEAAEASPAACTEAGIGSEPSHDISPDVTRVAVESATIADLAEEPSQGGPDAGTDSSCTMLADVGPVIADDAPVVVVDSSGQSDAPEVSTAGDPSHGDTVDVGPVAADEPAIVEVAEVESIAADVSPAAPVGHAEDRPDESAEGAPEALTDISGDAPSSSTVADGEPVMVDASAAAPIDLAETAPVDCPEGSISSDTAASKAVTVESAPTALADAAETSDEPVAVVTSPSAESRDVPKAPVKAAEPVDRATLIRRRWAETGIRMWNPRLHGTGEAALNIQGRIELLPPAPGETMPRYDKLEFRMLGGQIVCEGVIVEAPVHSGQRSFTVLAERRHAERAREASAGRQAVLA